MSAENPLVLITQKLPIESNIYKNKSQQELFDILTNYIEQLIQTDFNKLISILYRIDIDENKLRKVLSENKNTSSGKIILELMIEREKEKIILRKKYKQQNDKS
ncbi:MAG: hypothetical protein ACTJGD_00920 [Mesonia hippocampi]|uniref:hypothetical protein n=1 Tax=Mesonia hippocampi TaxID=1628250 RepID=UPI003F996FDB